MREIKFKAWDKQSKKFVGIRKNDYFSIRNDGFIGINNNSVENPQENYLLCQYTGLKDKNDKEIYEGDIIKEEFNHGICNCEIVYDNAGFFIENIKEEIKDNLHWHANGLEVIGNIYENPELLTN